MKTLAELTLENEKLKRANENLTLWYKISDRTVEEIYKKHLKLQSDFGKIISDIKHRINEY